MTNLNNASAASDELFLCGLDRDREELMPALVSDGTPACYHGKQS